MNRFFTKIVGACLVLSPIMSHGWNYTGHVVIAQIAYDQLDSIKKEKADKLAELIIEQLPEKQKEKLDKNFNNAASFAKVAALPDVWKKWKLSTLFLKFHAEPPTALISSWGQTTAEWHFIDIPYPEKNNCNNNTISPFNIVTAINILSKSLSTSNLPTKALELALLTHYIGDIHQPLHSVTNVSQSCLGDKGGNDFCLRLNVTGKCTKNLHSLWDSGVGYLKPHENIRALAFELESIYPKAEFENQITNKDPRNWSKESYSYSKTIYSLYPLESPSSDYYQKNQTIAKYQISLAGYRLADILQNIL